MQRRLLRLSGGRVGLETGGAGRRGEVAGRRVRRAGVALGWRWGGAAAGRLVCGGVHLVPKDHVDGRRREAAAAPREKRLAQLRRVRGAVVPTRGQPRSSLALPASKQVVCACVAQPASTRPAPPQAHARGTRPTARGRRRRRRAPSRGGAVASGAPAERGGGRELGGPWGGWVAGRRSRAGRGPSRARGVPLCAAGGGGGGGVRRCSEQQVG